MKVLLKSSESFVELIQFHEGENFTKNTPDLNCMH